MIPLRQWHILFLTFLYGAILQAISKYRGAYPRDRPAESGPELSQHGMELSIPGTNLTDSDINRGSIGKAKCLFFTLDESHI